MFCVHKKLCIAKSNGLLSGIYLVTLSSRSRSHHSLTTNQSTTTWFLSMWIFYRYSSIYLQLPGIYLKISDNFGEPGVPFGTHLPQAAAELRHRPETWRSLPHTSTEVQQGSAILIPHLCRKSTPKQKISVYTCCFWYVSRYQPGLHYCVCCCDCTPLDYIFMINVNLAITRTNIPILVF